MDIKQFNEVIEHALDRSREVLVQKGAEYSTNTDRLHNFNRGAEISGQSREKVLKGFMLKHLISVFDIIDGIDEGKIPTREFVNEKVGDSINYFLLLEASLVDRINNIK